jgi:hypothetical protein
MPSGSPISRAKARACLHRRRGRAPPAALRIEPPEHQVGIRDRRPRAAAAVADRPGLLPALSGPTRSMPAAIDPGDRAAAGADRAHIHHRQVDRQAIGDGELAETSGTPPAISATSVEVPPMS